MGTRGKKVVRVCLVGNHTEIGPAENALQIAGWVSACPCTYIDTYCTELTFKILLFKYHVLNMFCRRHYLADWSERATPIHTRKGGIVWHLSRLQNSWCGGSAH